MKVDIAVRTVALSRRMRQLRVPAQKAARGKSEITQK
jgi:hypothetical protein